jgi:hypothetical protein
MYVRTNRISLDYINTELIIITYINADDTDLISY